MHTRALSLPATARRWNADGYLEKLPVDPWGQGYVFRSDGNNFSILSFCDDGVEGGEGKNAYIDSRKL